MSKSKILLVFGHEDSKNSFNAAMKDVAIETLSKSGHEVKVSCLYDMKVQCFSSSDIKGKLDKPDQFNWNREIGIANLNGTVSVEIKQEQDKVTWADVIIYQFPIHSLSFPAVVVAWNEKILSPNFAQSPTTGNVFDNGLMKGKKILLSMTFSGHENMYTDTGMFGDINLFLYCMMKPFHFYGFSFLKPQGWFSTVPGNDESGKTNLEKWRQRLNNFDKEESLTNISLPGSSFSWTTMQLTDEFLAKCSLDEYAPTVGQHMGKKIPNIL